MVIILYLFTPFWSEREVQIKFLYVNPHFEWVIVILLKKSSVEWNGEKQENENWIS